MQIPIVVVGDEGGRFVSAIESQRGQVSVVRHVHEIGEMLGLAQSGIARAVLIVTGGENLTYSMVKSLHHLEVAVCLVTDQGDQPALEGVHPIDSLADTAEIVREIEKALDTLLNSEQDGAPSQIPDGQPLPSAPEETRLSGAEDIQDAPAQPQADGKIVAVWGPYGSPGRTTLAINLAAAYTEAGYSVCLMDADTYGASVGAALGLTDDYSSLAQLCHHADRGSLTPQQLKELTHTVAHHSYYLDIITGINRSDRWVELRSSALDLVLNQLATTYDVVVIDTSFCLEEDPALSFDGLTPQRNDATLTSLARADHLVAVGLADVVGVPRLIKAYDSLSAVLGPASPEKISIVFNRLRTEALGPATQAALEHSWERFGPDLPIAAQLPEDSATADKARLQGTTILESAPNTELAQQIRALAHTSQEALGLGKPIPPLKHTQSPNMVEKKKPWLRFSRRHSS
ncbi:MAG: P-loop NTPase [Rothia sp. (in: high G+C Gram-positive bacteria)]|uniref:AAA family ATPase n=1 Tax=Rothia sp. (in: high G+C Gram-positive bacteria) TaxID=1885016 RepID=UPI00270667AD|nr:P-loop NTPase [Rothia sp. (in: high G+C Gram-positive bacteria)]